MHLLNQPSSAKLFSNIKEYHDEKSRNINKLTISSESNNSSELSTLLADTITLSHTPTQPPSDNPLLNIKEYYE